MVQCCLRKHPRGTQADVEYALLLNIASEKFFYDILGHKTTDITFMRQFLDYMQRTEHLKYECY